MTNPTKRAAAMKAAPSPRRATKAAATVEPELADEDQADAPGDDQADIAFRGRLLRVRKPGPEQIVAWRRIGIRIERHAGIPWTEEEAADLIGKVMTILEGLLINAADVSWIEDLFLVNLKLDEAGDFITASVKAFVTEPQEEAPRTGPRPSRARRR
jgi:hypothetical protein